MGYFCNNEEEHKREGREDYERKGYYDTWKYGDPTDDCNRAYTDGYNRAEREDRERREERRQEEEREQRREYESAQRRRDHYESEF